MTAHLKLWPASLRATRNHGHSRGLFERYWCSRSSWLDQHRDSAHCFGAFEFRNGYPTPEVARALLEQRTFNRAIEVYSAHIPDVAMIETCRGLQEFGATRANQVVVWDSLMDACDVAAHCEHRAVYAIGFLYLHADGPTVVEA